MSILDPQSPPEPRTRVDAWSAVEGDLLSALREVAARDDGRQLVGDALTLAEHRQAERHARERADWDKPEPSPIRKLLVLARILTHLAAAVGGALVFSLISGWVS